MTSPRPQPAETGAAHGQLADEFGEQRVLGMRADHDPQVAHDGPNLALPVLVELSAVRVEERHPAHVGPARRILRGPRVQVPGEQGVAEGVPGQHVGAPA